MQVIIFQQYFLTEMCHVKFFLNKKIFCAQNLNLFLKVYVW